MIITLMVVIRLSFYLMSSIIFYRHHHKSLLALSLLAGVWALSNWQGTPLLSGVIGNFFALTMFLVALKSRKV